MSPLPTATPTRLQPDDSISTKPHDKAVTEQSPHLWPSSRCPSHCSVHWSACHTAAAGSRSLCSGIALQKGCKIKTEFKYTSGSIVISEKNVKYVCILIWLPGNDAWSWSLKILICFLQIWICLDLDHSLVFKVEEFKSVCWRKSFSG